MSHASSNDSGNNVVNDNDDDGGGQEPYYPPADRFLTAQMWWIASELVRRHPHLHLSGVEMDEGDRLLMVRDEQEGLSIQWDLVGGCKYLVNGVVTRISWIEMMAAAGPHETLKRIEVGCGLGIPQATPETTPRALAYRVIASALATAVDDRHSWFAVPAPMTPGEDHENPACDYFRAFPTTVEAREGYDAAIEAQLTAGHRVYFQQPFWAVLRDMQAIAIVDDAGVIHTIMGESQLMPLYEDINRNLTITTARVLGPYLP